MIVFYVYVAVIFLWTVIYPQISIAQHALGFQTSEIFARANHLTAIGLASFLAGWLGFFTLVPPTRRLSHPEPDGPLLIPNGFVPATLIALPFLVLSFPQQSILTAAYTSSEIVGAGLQINVLKPAAIVSILLALVSCVQQPNRLKKVVVGLLLLTLLGLSGFGSGNRVEELGCLLGAAWVIHGTRPFKAVPKLWILGGIVLCVFMLALGELRGSLASSELSLEAVGDALLSGRQLVPDAETLHMRPSTNGDVAVTLCVVIGLTETHIMEVDNGDTFFKYARMTLPRFLNADRPDELQVILSRLGLTGGGLYVLAEPYVAGGALGVMVVLVLFGMGVAWLEIRFLSRNLGRFAYLMYLLLLSCVPRWLLYSSFSMYKHVLTGLLVFACVRVAGSLLGRAASRSEIPQGAMPVLQ
jgi:hypothetical protein